MIYAPETMTDL